jgi:hypothetical protein
VVLIEEIDWDERTRTEVLNEEARNRSDDSQKGRSEGNFKLVKCGEGATISTHSGGNRVSTQNYISKCVT